MSSSTGKIREPQYGPESESTHLLHICNIRVLPLIYPLLGALMASDDSQSIRRDTNQPIQRLRFYPSIEPGVVVGLLIYSRFWRFHYYQQHRIQ
jgi:hypothetical protein